MKLTIIITLSTFLISCNEEGKSSVSIEGSSTFKEDTNESENVGVLDSASILENHRSKKTDENLDSDSFSEAITNSFGIKSPYSDYFFPFILTGDGCVDSLINDDTEILASDQEIQIVTDNFQASETCRQNSKKAAVDSMNKQGFDRFAYVTFEKIFYKESVKCEYDMSSLNEVKLFDVPEDTDCGLFSQVEFFLELEANYYVIDRNGNEALDYSVMQTFFQISSDGRCVYEIDKLSQISAGNECHFGSIFKMSMFENEIDAFSSDSSMQVWSLVSIERAITSSGRDFYEEGTANFEINNWNGHLTYSQDLPVYEASNGEESLSVQFEDRFYLQKNLGSIPKKLPKFKSNTYSPFSNFLKSNRFK